MKQSTSLSWDRKIRDSLNQDNKAKEISEFHLQPELVLRYQLHRTTRGTDTTCLQPDSQNCKKLAPVDHQFKTQGSHQHAGTEHTKDHQSTQEALMSTSQRTNNTTPRQPVTKKTPPQAFLPDPRSGGTSQVALVLQLTTVTTGNTFPRPHKQPTRKPVISKAAFQASWTEGATVLAQTTRIMSQSPTDQGSATGNKWKVLA